MPPRRWFTRYARYFSTVEINYTFYRLSAEKTFLRWREQDPLWFVYALKAPRTITHLRKLRECKEVVDRFLDRARLLGSKLGPILYRLPRNWHCNVERLDALLRLLPADLQHVIEFRRESWHDDEVLDLLREKGMTFCHVSLPDLDCPMVVTGPIVYARMHGLGVKYSGSYDKEQLQEVAGRAADHLDQGSDTFVYFNNDAQAHAVQNAWELGRLVENLLGGDDAQRSYALQEAG